jgi:lipopolysaccharide/colanic/teichoic acid biosynthesis glycosyltransferase
MRPPQQWYPSAKRLFDLAIALLLLVPTLAVLTALATAALVLHGRPVMLFQQRIGRHGRPFVIVKLRTMAGPTGKGRAFREHHRLTGFGSTIRRLRLDEIPQILHVLTGTMSLVGPRPLIPEHLAEVGGGGRRHDVRPGITCFAQLELAEYGYLDKHRQISLDEEYVENISLRTDLAIVQRTVMALFARNAARPPLARFEPDNAGWPRAQAD